MFSCKYSLLIFVFFWGQEIYAQENNLYKIEPGDTLSTIAQRFFPESRIYGKNGSLAQIIKLNKSIVNPDYILPKHIVYLEIPRQLANEEIEGTSQNFVLQKNEDVQIDQESLADDKIVEAKDDEPWLRLMANIFNTQLAGHESTNGTKGRIVSNINYGINVSSIFNWSTKLKFFPFVEVNYYSFKQLSKRNIENKNQFSSNFGLGLSYEAFSNTNLNLKLEMSEELFYRATSLTQIQVDGVYIPKASFQVEQVLAQKNKNKMGLSGEFAFIFKQTNDIYSIKSGAAYRGGIFIKKQDKVAASFYYLISKQDTNIVNIERKDVGLLFSLIF